MHFMSHRVFLEWPGEPGCGAVLSTGVYCCSWLSFGFAVSFLCLSWPRDLFFVPFLPPLKVLFVLEVFINEP